MKRTIGPYKFPFFLGGDLYGAGFDSERNTTTDNQLADLSDIVGDGVLSGWTVCHVGPDEIEVQPGVGFIHGIINKTLSIQRRKVLDNVQSQIYMQSLMLANPNILKLETESPASNLVAVNFIDTTPPAQPTGFVATPADFDVINLFWNANIEVDFDHYQIWRSTNIGGPFTQIASPTTNGINPTDPFQDTGLIAATAYFYRLYAVDHSGNISTFAAANTSTLPDTRKPAEPGNFQLYSSNGSMSMTWTPSVAPNVVYRITQQVLNVDGSIASTTVYDNLTTLYWQITGLANSVRVRITLQSKGPNGVLSDGSVAEAIPASSAAPLDPLLPVTPSNGAISGLQAVMLNWQASLSPLGSASGQVKSYQVRVLQNAVSSAPVNVGTLLTKNVVSYNDQAVVGQGLTHTLSDNVFYVFRISAIDALGHESAGLFVTQQTIDNTPPNDPRDLQFVAGDTTATAFWKHSSSPDTVGYVININTGFGFGPDINIDYLTTYAIGGLTNGNPVIIKIRAKDLSGNISSPGVTATTIPTLDVTPPAIPTALNATSEDQQVVVTWNPNGEPDFNHYVLTRSAVSQTLAAIPNKNLTVITELPKSLTIGKVTTVNSTSSFNSDDLVSYPTMVIVGTVIVFTSGILNGQKSTVVGFNPANGGLTLATPFSQLPRIGDNFSVKLTSPSLGTVTRNVGKVTEILDIELLNGQTYAYSLQAVDNRGNASAFTSPVLVVPDCGLNDLNPVTNLTGVFSAGTIVLSWQDIVPTPDHPATDHSAFNIYRSTNPFSAFQLIDSTPAKVISSTLSAVSNNGDMFSNALIGLSTSPVGLTIIMRSGAASGQQSIIQSYLNSVTGEIGLATPFTAAPLSGDSFDISTTNYTDSNLLNGLTYYYIVTAVRDNATVIVTNSAIAPPNSVLLATVKINLSTPLGCNITEIQNEQRLVANLYATIFEETEALLLAHHHSVRPINSITITAVPLLSAIDAADLAAFDFTTTPTLSPAALTYYKNLITDSVTGKAIPYDRATTYVISPSNIVYNLPYVGDFQVLVNGAKPTVEFEIDPDNNLIIFPIANKTSDLISFDGTGFDYYVPAQIDLGFRGFDIFVNGVAATPAVDEVLQTIRFVSALDASSVVTIVIDPVVPDFDNLQGARQVSLNPNIVLSDFTTANGTLFSSASGAFDSTDTFFVLVDGVRTSLSHSVDTTAKTILFDTAVASTSTVTLEILNREEVQNTLPVSKILNIDASSFKTGVFLKAQLPPIDHDGRISEPALPVFQPLTTTDKYVYAAPTGIVGSATTPYALFQFNGGDNDGDLLLGTSTGLMKSVGFAAFNGDGDSTTNTIDYTQNPPSGIKFTAATADTVVNAAKLAATTSCSFQGDMTIRMLVGSQPQDLFSVQSPTLTILQDGKILIAGGAIYREAQGDYVETTASYIYDPSLGYMVQVGNLNNARRDHAAVLLPSGNVLVVGGSQYSVFHTSQVTFQPDAWDIDYLASVEMFDIVLKQWLNMHDMNITRGDPSCSLLSTGEVLVAGGLTGFSQYDAVFTPPQSIPPKTTLTAELYDPFLNRWTITASLNRTRIFPVTKVDKDIVIVSGGQQPGRELYTRSPIASWTYQGDQTQQVQGTLNATSGLGSIDSPVKQFFQDSFGFIFLATRNSVYVTQDGETFVKTKGLDAVGVVHRVSQSSDGTLFAATDLGVYEITPDIHAQMTWFQGGLIGSGTTETFDLQPVGIAMLAGSEIGIFSSIDDGNTWSQLVALPNIYNIELVGSILFANSNQDLYRSDDFGLTWTKIETLSFLDPNSRMVSRTPLDLFFATAQGLFATRDGITFFLVDFDQNRHPAGNNVHMAEVIGSDLIVGYDNLIMSVGPEFETIILAQFVGIVPTVLVNGIEIRDGFRYDTIHSTVIFELKRLVNDTVQASSNYGLYQLINGPWYRNRPNAAVIVYVNGVIADDSGLILDSRLGQVTFNTDLTKTDTVTVSIAETQIKNAGEFYHNELEDRFEESKGLPLSLGRDYTGNILQMGLSVEHNFLERGLERNQYYCAQNCLVDRSFTSFLPNAEFYIMGRRPFDRFNSTIDYNLESQQLDIGTRSLVSLSALEVSSDLWIGTENGIFVLDPTAPVPFSIINTIIIGSGISIRDMEFFQGTVWLVTSNGLYIQVDVGTPPDEIPANPIEITSGGETFFKNAGNGLPSDLFVFNSLNNVAIIGTSDAIYYSDGLNQNPAYSIWFRAAFIEHGGTQVYLANGPCHCITVGDGTAYAAIGASLFTSTDGKTWTHVYDFDPTLKLSIIKLAYFAKKLYIGTDQGVYTDDGTIRTDSASTRLEITDTTTAASKNLGVNDMFVFSNGSNVSLYVVGDNENVYHLTNETWTTNQIPGSVSIERFIIVNGSRQVALGNDTVFVQ